MNNAIASITVLQRSPTPGMIRINIKAASEAAVVDCFVELPFSQMGQFVSGTFGPRHPTPDIANAARIALLNAGDTNAMSRKVTIPAFSYNE